MHADGVGHGLEIQRAQEFDAEGQEGILLAHDFRRHLEDGLGPLVQRLDQPAGLGGAIGDKGLLHVRARTGGDHAVIAFVHDQARQGVRVQLDLPAAGGIGPDMHIGDHRLGRLAAEAGTGPGRQGLQLGDHLGHVLGVDPADLPQRRQIAFGQQVEVGQQAVHRRIKPVALDQLQLQAFRHRPGHDARRLETMANRQDRLDPFQRNTQTVGNFGQFAAQIAALIDGIDQGQGDGVVG